MDPQVERPKDKPLEGNFLSSKKTCCIKKKDLFRKGRRSIETQ